MLYTWIEYIHYILMLLAILFSFHFSYFFKDILNMAHVLFDTNRTLSHEYNKCLFFSNGPFILFKQCSYFMNQIHNLKTDLP